METAGWLSAAVEKIWLFRVGMVVFFSISLVLYSSQSLNTKRERGDIQEQYILHVAFEHSGLNLQHLRQLLHRG